MAQKRQLVAILFADVQGFTTLVQQDEERAKIIQDKFHGVLESVVKTHQGRIIYFQGDGVFCIFKSAVTAVLAAIEVQQHMLSDPKVPLRIGIHLGDVIVEGKDVFGDGVNVASRVESFALPGSVFITDLVFHEIRNHAEIKAVSLGKYEFKNVSEPVEMYAISNAGLIVPQEKNLPGKGRVARVQKYWNLVGASIILIAAAIFLYLHFFKHPVDNKSIAVIPFINLSNDPREEYLSDGITEDILTSISNIAELKVTSFASTRQYRGTKKNIRQIADELKVAYVLEGSVQRSGNKLRITAQLINALDDAHIWAKNYDESISEVLSIQSKVASEIAAVLKARLSKDEKRRIEKPPTLNPDAYQLYLKGRYYWNQRTLENLDTSIQFFSQAIQLDPLYALAYSGIADAYTVLADNGYLPTDSVSMKAKYAVDKALELDSSLAEVRASYAIYLSSMEGNGTAAIKVLERIIQLNPNYASAFQWYAIELSAKGKFETAREMIEKAIILDPRSNRIYISKALIYLYAKDFNKAIDVLSQAPGSFSNKMSYKKLLADLFFLKGAKDSARYYARLCNNQILLSIINRDKPTFIKKMAEIASDNKVSAETIANYYSLAGEKDSAFIWLDKSVEKKEFGGLKFLAVSPYWDTLRSDLRFAVLLQSSGIR